MFNILLNQTQFGTNRMKPWTNMSDKGTSN
jgi:hypothetical protein